MASSHLSYSSSPHFVDGLLGAFFLGSRGFCSADFLGADLEAAALGALAGLAPSFLAGTEAG